MPLHNTMSKTTTSDITALGLTSELFKSLKDLTFDQLCGAVIAEQALILEGRIGSSVYASTVSPINKYVARAEKCLVAAELVQRRINLILSNAVGAGREIDITHEGAQKKAYRDEAELWITKLISGGSADTSEITSGVLVSDHFGGTSA